MLQIFYPATCFGCGELLPDSDNATSSTVSSQICDRCRNELADDDRELCPRCAASVGKHANVERGCGTCRKERFRFDGALRLTVYGGRARELILRMKHETGEPLAQQIGELWANQRRAQFEDADADLIVPIPLHWWRRFRRGYNQSEALAQSLAKVLRLPCRTSVLRRIRATPPQARQSAAERRVNVQGAFRASSRSRLNGKTVLLVDDVITTGSTMSEAAKMLKLAGANRVIAAAVARAGDS